MGNILIWLIPLALLVGVGIGWFLCQRQAARDLRRVTLLVPEVWLLRWAAGMVNYLIRTQPTDEDVRALEWVQRLFDLANRIEMGGVEGEGK